MVRYGLFDLDGTLTESGPGIMAGVQVALNAIGIEETDTDSLVRFIGPPLVDSFKRFYGVNEEDAGKALKAYRAYYDVEGVYNNAPYPGILEMLAHLKERGLSMAISSSKPQNMVDLVLDHFLLRPYFDLTVCGEDHGPLFTKSGVVAETIRRLALRDHLSEEEVKKNAVMIGDRHHDIGGGKENGLRTIGVRWGYAPEGELEEAGAEYIAGDANELEELLLSL